MATPVKRLLIRADDAGGSRAANEAIVQAIEAGTVRNVSFMACGLEWEHGAELLRPFVQANRIALGLHVVLNAEWDRVKWGPVSPPETVPSLLDGDTEYFTPAPSVLHKRGFSVSEAITEVTAQLARMRSAGIPPVYLDEHMGVGWIRDLHVALHQFCQGENLINADKQVKLRQLDLSYFFDYRKRPLSPESMVDVWLNATMNTNAETLLLVTHPGKLGLDMDDYGTASDALHIIARERDVERQALCLPSFAQKCQEVGVQWIRYDAL